MKFDFLITVLMKIPVFWYNRTLCGFVYVMCTTVWLARCTQLAHVASMICKICLLKHNMQIAYKYTRVTVNSILKDFLKERDS